LTRAGGGYGNETTMDGVYALGPHPPRGTSMFGKGIAVIATRRILFVGLGLLGVAGFWAGRSSGADAPADLIKAADRHYMNGNVKDAYESFRRALLDPTYDGEPTDALIKAGDCLDRLSRIHELDAFLEAIVEAHPTKWRVLDAVAHAYQRANHQGFVVAGKFERGLHRGGGTFVTSFERDRVRALQLKLAAMPLVDQHPNVAERGYFYFQLAEAIGSQNYNSRGWRLQSLTDVTKLPDYEPGYSYGGDDVGAPVDADGNPLFYGVPASWDEAKSDGERWRWALAAADRYSPSFAPLTKWAYAEFLNSQFGVQTMAQFAYDFGRFDDDANDKDRPQTFALHTLGDDETIARLATGVKRFRLPAEHNPIALYKSVLDSDEHTAGSAYDRLAETFSNRRQYDRAAEMWRTAMAKLPRDGRAENWKEALDQIVGNWGRFEGGKVQPAGRGASLDFCFRNAKSVEFTAHALHIDRVVSDLKSHLRRNPQQIDYQKINLDQLGYRIVTQDQSQYVGDEAARWKLELEPRPNHFDRRITVTTPLQKAGAYLVTAKLPDGNTSRIIIWIADMALVRKSLDGNKWWIYTADAVTGRPLPKANVEFFGFWQHQLPGAGNNPRWTVETADLAEKTDADGQLVYDFGRTNEKQFNWLTIARTEDGRFAYHGFSSVWGGSYHDQQYNETKVYGITDRPVYRPKQPVHFKFWIRQARYDDAGESFANQDFQVELRDPEGTVVWTKSLHSDAYGGIAADYELPSEAKLGVYQLTVVNRGGMSFRVEEYKKPEFEVNVSAPSEPVQLGEKITAELEAKYYFGAPVTSAKVKYKVLRSSRDAAWFPHGRWDWLYGRGYWWFGYDYAWYPGFARWGCFRPTPWWWHRQPQPPEVVAERETEIGPDGKLKIEFDTALAKELHGDTDHRYEITAEVTDQSRRTIVGSGEVLVARRPFRVFAWVDRGHYRVGETIHAEFSAHTLAEKPVVGQGKATLFAIRYDEAGDPHETAVQTWNLDTNAEGRAEQQLQASAAGQFRLAYELTDAAGHTQEGGYVFTITGEGFDGAQFRFNAVELVPDKREYAPGERVRLLVNTDRVGSTVLLFVRPSNGVYLPPRLLHLKGKSTEVEVDVALKDMPNFFLEAVTVADGRLHSEMKEIVVPPESRVVDITAKPTKPEYLPGEEAEIEFTLRDAKGQAFVGQTVVAVYDKAVEYISGGSNVPDIKAFFWKWRRQHSPGGASNLDDWFGPLTKPGDRMMTNLGVFGATTADEGAVDGEMLRRDEGDARRALFKRQAGAAPGGMGLGGGGFGGAGGFAAPMAAAAPMALGMAQAADAVGLRSNAAAAESAPNANAVQPTVRSNFADTALWVAALETNSDGIAKVKLKMPENLTTWKVRTWAVGRGTNVGETAVDVVTTKNLIVRLQAPRFFVERDEVVLSANVHNYLKSKKQVRVELQLNGPALRPLGESVQTVEVAADGESRVDFRVRAMAEGEAVVRVRALTDEESDAVEMKFPTYVHGMLKTESFAGAIRPDQESGKITFDVPAERRVEQSRLEVRYSPTLAGAMVDALPYLVDYPYGCTEQTLSRFLPSVITQKVLLESGLDLKQIRDKRTNLNAQEIGDDRKRAAQWKRFDHSPVFDDAEVARMVKAGIERLTDMQCSDGGWGWFSGYGEHSYPHTTAYVVHGLQIAKQNDVAIVPDVLDRGIAWLRSYQDEQVALLKNGKKQKGRYKTQADNLDAFVFMVLVDADVRNAEMLAFLDRDRPQLSVYALSLFGMALHKLGETEKLGPVLTNLSQYVVEDDENQTAWLQLPESNYWWYWYGSENEAMAYYLKLLARVEPKGRVAPRLVKYLLNNRKHGTYWTSTRDTALCIESLADYLRGSEEGHPDLTLEVWLDGTKRKEVRIDAENLFSFDNAFVLEGEALAPGRHTLELRKRGTGPIYFNAYQTNFTQEAFITKAGLEVKVERKFYRLERVDAEKVVAGSRGQALAQKVEKFERRAIPNLAVLKSGDLVEVELEIESKNDYEYLLFEDMKAAGFEPVDVRSGYNGNGLGAYMELRDERVCLFARVLPRGRHSIAYRLRAEIPGKFSALPTRASAMYAPELRANSDEMQVSIED
jgi:uncharacterized protein YfaS (alpha-2-macroglobulin family)